MVWGKGSRCPFFLYGYLNNSTIYWKIILSPLFGNHLCHRSSVCICVSTFGFYSLFYWSICPCTNITLITAVALCQYLVVLGLRLDSPGWFWHSQPLNFHICFRIRFLISTKHRLELWLRLYRIYRSIWGETTSLLYFLQFMSILFPISYLLRISLIFLKMF